MMGVRITDSNDELRVQLVPRSRLLSRGLNYLFL